MPLLPLAVEQLAVIPRPGTIKRLGRDRENNAR
jgi:hypothetical protein